MDQISADKCPANPPSPHLVRLGFHPHIFSEVAGRPWYYQSESQGFEASHHQAGSVYRDMDSFNHSGVPHRQRYEKLRHWGLDRGKKPITITPNCPAQIPVAEREATTPEAEWQHILPWFSAIRHTPPRNGVSTR